MILDRRFMLAVGGGLVLAPQAFAQTRRIPFEHAGGKIFAPVAVNGQPVQAFLDSGSQFLGIDAAYAAEIGIKPTGRQVVVRGVQNTLRGRIAKVESLSVGGFTLSNLEALVIDYGGIAATVGRPVEMALGFDFFRRFVVDLDFADHTLALHSRGDFTPPAGAAEVSLQPSMGLLAAPVVFPSGTLWALVDTGSDSPLIVSPGPAGRIGLFRGRSSTAPLGGIGGGAVSRITSAPRLTLGGVAFEDVPVQAPPRNLGVEANLGLGLLGRFRLYMDFGGRRMWMAPGGETGPFKRDLLGFYGQVEGERIRVTHVGAGSPAAAAGFRAGEMVTAINGRPAGAANLALRGADVGTGLTFTLEGGRTRTLRLARYY